MANTKRTQKVQSVVTRSLEVVKVSVIVDSKQVFQEICEKIVPSTAAPESLSVSVFKYIGHSWEGGSIFAGFCETLGKGKRCSGKYFRTSNTKSRCLYVYG
jgi:hypothetical protein